MFLDSIFRDYSIPAFYFHRIEESAGPITNTFFEIVDGQQRVDAIFTYSENAFQLIDPSDTSGFRFPNFVKDRPCPWAGLRYKELHDDLKKKLRNTKIVAYELTTNDENEIRDLFIRLQGGTALTPQDKRDSWPGNFTEFVLILFVRIGGLLRRRVRRHEKSSEIPVRGPHPAGNAFFGKRVARRRADEVHVERAGKIGADFGGSGRGRIVGLCHGAAT